MFLEKVFIRANPVAATNPSVDLAVYFESLCPDSIRSGWDFHMLSPVVICNFGFPVLIFTWDFVKLRFVSHDVPSAWRLFGQDLRISYKPFGKASVREAPFNKMPPLFGHCPFGGGGLNPCPDGLGHFFREEFSKFKGAFA